MLTERSYIEDPYAKEGKGKAVKVEFTDLVVDKSVFVPTGDGQPNDRGDVIIDDKKYVIVDAWYDGEGIHLMSLDTYPTDIIGKEVNQVIDWNIRYLHMRFRTALYILQGIAVKDYSANCRINQTYDDSAWIDIYLDNITEDTVNAILEKARAIVKASVELKTRFVTKAEFQASSELMAVTKGKVPDFEKIKLVKIQDYPEFPDMGTQVRNTSEVGVINIKTTLVKGKINNRLSITLS
ncbi:MAG: alanyl-tRNA editing protein [Candidatus Thermoplasmatota archaeon]|nr:alanyl-tRNA editing protein [Candidatus Thermoplasmatota archaeon]